jgi:DNA-binding MarR family transcriptional regulator
MEIGKETKTNFVSSNIKAIVNIRYTNNWMSNIQNKYMSKHDLSMPQFNILRILRGAKSKLNVNTVKDRMIEKSPNTTRLMDKLVEKKLIDRTRNEKDKRIIEIKITKKGLDLLELIDVDFDKEIVFVSNLTEEESETLSNLLDKLRG